MSKARHKIRIAATPERKKRAAMLIQRWKPWEKSTGPKTDNGKAVVSRNALKHDARSAETLKVRAILSNRA